MTLWFVPLNVLVAALCIHSFAWEHHPVGHFYSNALREGTLLTVAACPQGSGEEESSTCCLW